MEKNSVFLVIVGATAGAALTLLLTRKSKTKRLERTDQPNPGWKPGDKTTTPYDNTNFVSIDPCKTVPCYPLLVSAIAPRPVVCVSTVNKEGQINLAPFSYFGICAQNPPCVMVAVTEPRSGIKKDSLENIEETGQFVVNMVSEWMAEAANFTGKRLPPDVDELTMAGLTAVDSVKVKPPRVAESAVQIECRVIHRHDIRDDHGAITTRVFLARIVLFHVAAELCDKSGDVCPVVSLDGYAPLLRFGDDTYGGIGPVFSISTGRPNNEECQHLRTAESVAPLRESEDVK